MYLPIAKSSGVSTSILPPIFMIGGAIVGTFSYLKNTLLLKQYAKRMQLHSNNGPVEPSVKLEDMVVEVCEDLRETISEHTTIRPVLIPGTFTKHSGTVNTFQGGVIGLPCFFEFNKIDDIDGKIQWEESSALGITEIYNAFLLSDEAKKYGIAREILLVNTPQVYIDTILPIIMSFLVNKLAMSTSFKSEVLKVTSNSKNAFCVLLIIVVIAVWRSLHMNLQRYYEHRAENEISKLGEDYIRGAIEYNTKTIQRNLCSASMKDQRYSVLKNASDLTYLLFSAKERPTQKVQFYKHLRVSSDE